MVALLRPTVDPAGRQRTRPPAIGKTSRGGDLRLVVDNTLPDTGRPSIAGIDRSALLTVVIAATVVFGSLFAVRLTQDVTVEDTAPDVVTTPGPGDGYVPAPGDGYIVAKSGDSLWSIATTIAPESDPRPVVAVLIEANGDDSVQIGQQIIIPQQLLD